MRKQTDESKIVLMTIKLNSRILFKTNFYNTSNEIIIKPVAKTIEEKLLGGGGFERDGDPIGDWRVKQAGAAPRIFFKKILVFHFDKKTLAYLILHAVTKIKQLNVVVFSNFELTLSYLYKCLVVQYKFDTKRFFLLKVHVFASTFLCR